MFKLGRNSQTAGTHGCTVFWRSDRLVSWSIQVSGITEVAFVDSYDQRHKQDVWFTTPRNTAYQNLAALLLPRHRYHSSTGLVQECTPKHLLHRLPDQSIHDSSTRVHIRGSRITRRYFWMAPIRKLNKETVIVNQTLPARFWRPAVLESHILAPWGSEVHR